MSITVNGKKVAGIGPAGLSPYQVAKAGGYTGTEQEFNQQLAQLNQLFTSVSEGKALIAAAVTDKGVETAADATFQQMAENITAISSGGTQVETITITNNSGKYVYVTVYTEHGIMPAELYSGERSDVIKGSVLYSSSHATPVTVQGDFESLGFIAYGETYLPAYRVNGDCVISAGGN